MKRLHRQAGWWFGLTLLGFTFWPLVLLGIAAFGLGIGLTDLFFAVFSPRRLEGAVGTLVVASIFSLGITTNIWLSLGVYRKSFWNRAHYAGEVARIEKMSPEERSVGGRGGVVDEGPPVRVAFRLGGCLDNLSGIVRDPTGLVLRARKFKRDQSNWKAPELAEIRRLFGGCLIHAWHVWGPWSFCAFT